LDMKNIELVVDHNKNPWISAEKWIQRHVFTNLHEIFFIDFINILAELIHILVDHIRRFHIVDPKNWTLELIWQVNTIINWVSCTIDFWLDCILRGYITGIYIDCTMSYSVAKREFFKGPNEIYLKSLSTLINMLLCDNGVMKMEYDLPSS